MPTLSNEEIQNAKKSEIVGKQLDTLMKHLEMYQALHRDLERLYYRTKWWQFIRREVLLHRQGKLTKNYGRWLDEWQKSYNFQKDGTQE